MVTIFRYDTPVFLKLKGDNVRLNELMSKIYHPYVVYYSGRGDCPFNLIITGKNEETGLFEELENIEGMLKS